jgi:hypothetical protein
MVVSLCLSLLLCLLDLDFTELVFDFLILSKYLRKLYCGNKLIGLDDLFNKTHWFLFSLQVNDFTEKFRQLFLYLSNFLKDLVPKMSNFKFFR